MIRHLNLGPGVECSNLLPGDQTNDILLISPQVSLEVRKCSKFERQKQVEDRAETEKAHMRSDTSNSDLNT